MVKMLRLAPEISLESHAEVKIFAAVLSNCTHLTAKYTQKTYYTLIYVQEMYTYWHRRFFVVRIGACVVRVAVPSTVAYIVVQTNVARNAFRDSTIKRLAGRNWLISLRGSDAPGFAFGSPAAR